SFVLLSLLESLFALVAFVFIIIISIRHYLKTKSRGAMLVMSSLIGTVLISLVTTLMASQISSSMEMQFFLIGNAIFGFLFLVFAYGFSLICKRAE
ncbi:MAG: hypothetical protein KUG78_19125, partial [Kangiellaceae bacterium]|nr:hypothetical protein [Kangiellaceae bacterium]